MKFFYKYSLVRRWHLLTTTLLLLMGMALASCTSLLIPNTGAEPTIVPTPQDWGTVTVTIINPGLSNVIVRVLDNPWVDILADDNKLLLHSCDEGQFITAWSPGYYISTQQCHQGVTNYEFSLIPYSVNDNVYYSWVEAQNIGQQRSCEPCHSNVENGMAEYIEWKKDGHSTVFSDSRFWTMYLGANIYGNRSPNTRWIISENSTHKRLAPDSFNPYFGPGFKLDYPLENGNCVYCHAPASVTGSPSELDLSSVINSSNSGKFYAATEGVNCDVCHKVLNVRLAQNNRPYPDKPGILSYDFVREDQNSGRLYVGPLPGVNTEGTDILTTCSPVFSRSEFCAPCHYGKFWDTQVYNSYGEWLDSPYSKDGNEGDYKTCQSCHMVVNNGTLQGDTSVRTSERAACSESNTNHEDFSHNMMQAGDDNLPNLIKNAAEIKLEASKVDGKIQFKVRVTNASAGHKFPTDSPLRHLILFIEARDNAGTLLQQIDGPQIPVWGGTGNQANDYSGKPGEIYANILMDMDTNMAPTVSYWNPTKPAWDGSDTRLEPRKPAESNYTFSMPSNGYAKFTVKLIYRYAFIDIARLKGWNTNDIIVTQVETEVH